MSQAYKKHGQEVELLPGRFGHDASKPKGNKPTELMIDMHLYML